MQKKMKYFLFAGLSLFFASTSVAWAETCEVPTSCDTGSGWHIQLLEVTQQSTEVCNSILEIEECYRWRYQVYNQYGTTAGLTQLLFTFPIICGAKPLLEAGEVATFELYEPGVGDSTSGFGKDIKSISVARLAPNNSQGYFSFYSTEKKMTEATVAVAVKKGDGSCVIGGPSQYGPETNEEPFTVSSEQIITTSDGQRFLLIEDVDTQCISEAYEVDESGNMRLLTKELIESNLYSKAGLEPGEEGNPLEYVGLTNQKCNRSIAKSKGPHTWYFISGMWMWR